jgi:hypothetical protein
LNHTKGNPAWKFHTLPNPCGMNEDEEGEEEYNFIKESWMSYEEMSP